MTGHPGRADRHESLTSSGPIPSARRDDRPLGVSRPSVRARVTAVLRQGRFDRMLAVGASPHPGSALAVHAERIVAFAEREAIARTLHRALQDSREPLSELVAGRVPVHRQNLAAAHAAIETLTLRLHSPTPVAARGMARLRLVLSDGTGPFYEHGRGDLIGRLGAARAAL